MFEMIINQFRLTWRLLRDRRVPILTKLIPVVTVLYIISPIDLIPDVLVAIGLVDDIAVLLAGLRFFESVVPRYIVDEHRQALTTGKEPEVVESTASSKRKRG